MVPAVVGNFSLVFCSVIRHDDGMVHIGTETERPRRRGRPRKIGGRSPRESFKLTEEQLEAVDALAHVETAGNRSLMVRRLVEAWLEVHPQIEKEADHIVDSGLDEPPLNRQGRTRLSDPQVVYEDVSLQLDLRLRVAIRVAVAGREIEKAAFWREEIVKPYLEVHSREVRKAVRAYRRYRETLVSAEISMGAGRRQAALTQIQSESFLSAAMSAAA